MLNSLLPRTEKIKLSEMKEGTARHKNHKVHMFACDYGIHYNKNYGDISILYKNKDHLKTIFPFKCLLRSLKGHVELLNFIRYELLTETLMFRIKRKLGYTILIVEHETDPTKIQIHLKNGSVTLIQHLGESIPVVQPK